MQREDIWIHTVCNMCLGDCGILVRRVNGVVVEVKGDPDCPNSRGKVCSKASASIMNLYDPNRVKTPLKRTNPEKGLGLDPGWVPISWDEALKILEEKLSKIREEDPRKLSISTFDNTTRHQMVGHWSKAFGTPNFHWGGYYCGQYLHSSMYLTNGTFHCDFDADYINYLILFGNQAGFGAGLNPNITIQKVAKARKRGLKVVVVDPVCTQAASKADVWVPIRPGTDGALVLAMINVLINDLGFFDRAFIKKYTNGPYLVKPDGHYLRQNGKPLVWDAEENQAKPHDAEIKDYALEGSYTIDGESCKPAFQLLREHVKKYTPEMASEITTIAPSIIRALANDFGKEARIGSSIVVDGVELPYRPVAANIYRGAGAHKHGVGVALGVMILNLTVGAFYVPGSHRGMNLVGPSWEWAPGEYEGLITPPAKHEISHGANYYTYKVKPPERADLRELYPISTNQAPMFLATGLEPEKYQLPYKSEMLIVCRRNLILGGCNYKLTAEVLQKYKFIAAFCITLDEMSEFADLVLPETTFLERLQVMPNSLNWSHTAQTGYFFWGIRQPAVAPIGESRYWADVLLELADRMGFLGDLYEILNVNYGLKDPYKLDPANKYTPEEIGDRRYKSQFGQEKGLEWFKQNGYVSAKRTVDELYPLPWLKVRFPLYYENIMDAGRKVKQVTDGMGIENWDISDYTPLPDWKPCCSYNPSDDFEMKACSYRLPTQSMSWTAQNPWLAELAELNPYAQKILINTETAKRKNINDKDKICVESPVGKVVGEAKVTGCVHPEVVGMTSHFGSLARGKPVAYAKSVNCYSLMPFDTDPVSAGVDACVMVKVYKV